MLPRKDGHDGRGKVLLDDPCYAMTIPPGKDNARTWFTISKYLCSKRNKQKKNNINIARIYKNNTYVVIFA